MNENSSKGYIGKFAIPKPGLEDDCVKKELKPVAAIMHSMHAQIDDLNKALFALQESLGRYMTNEERLTVAVDPKQPAASDFHSELCDMSYAITVARYQVRNILDRLTI